MSHKRLPYFFLSCLLLVLFFVVGLRWGQNIEKTNKVVNYLISIPPTATVAPTQIPFGLITYEHAGCGIKFLKLNTSEVISEATNGAMLQEKGKPILSFDCSKNFQTSPTATDSVTLTFQKKTITATQKDGKYLFQLSNPFSGVVLSFFVDKSYYPLLEKSLEFVSK